jgi:hypothetical protein
MSHRVSLGERYRCTAMYVGKNLKGAKPPDLPAGQPTKFEGVGTSRLARRLTTILHAMALAEAIEMTCIPSLACHVIAIKFPGLA